MDAETIAAVGDLFDAVTARHSISHLTAVMVSSMQEALFPAAPDHAKDEVLKQVERYGGRVGRQEFLELVNFLKSSVYCTNEELAASCKNEAKRQRGHASKSDPHRLPITPSASITADMRREIEDRDRVIKEQREHLALLQTQLEAAQQYSADLSPAKKEKSSALETVLYLEKRCQEAESQLRLVSGRLASYGDYTGRSSRVIQDARATAKEMNRMEREARMAALTQSVISPHHRQFAAGGGTPPHHRGSPPQTPSATAMLTPPNPLRQTPSTTPTDTILPSQTLMTIAEADRILRGDQLSGMREMHPTSQYHPQSPNFYAPHRMNSVYHMIGLERERTMEAITPLRSSPRPQPQLTPEEAVRAYFEEQGRLQVQQQQQYQQQQFPQQGYHGGNSPSAPPGPQQLYFASPGQSTIPPTTPYRQRYAYTSSTPTRARGPADVLY